MFDIWSLKVGDRINFKTGECKIISCDKTMENKTMENKTMGKSYTFTREELIKTMRDGVIEMLKDNVEGVVDGSVEIGFFENWQDIDNKDTNDLIQWWCDMYSDSFFDANPDIDDALILTEKNGNDTFKEWMASR